MRPQCAACFLHFNFRRSANRNHRNATSEFRQALLQLLLIIIGSGLLDLRADGADARLDLRRIACAFHDGGVLLVNLDLTRRAELSYGGLLQFEAKLFGNHLATGEDRDILQHCLAACRQSPAP